MNKHQYDLKELFHLESVNCLIASHAHMIRIEINISY